MGPGHFWGQHQQLGYRWFTDLEASVPGEDIVKFSGALFVLYGDLDEVVPPAVAQSVVTKAINASTASHYVVKGADHGLGLLEHVHRIRTLDSPECLDR